MTRACVLCLLAVLSVYLVGCGHPTVLAKLSVTPDAVTIVGTGGGAQAQFHAFGQYINPNEIRDITNLVKWSSGFPSVASIDSKGLATSGFTCGVTIITATAGQSLGVPGDAAAITTATATFTVSDPNDPLCPK